MALESLSKWFIKFSLCLLIRIQIKALGILVRGKKYKPPMIPRGVNLCRNEVYIWYGGPSLVGVLFG